MILRSLGNSNLQPWLENQQPSYFYFAVINGVLGPALLLLLFFYFSQKKLLERLNLSTHILLTVSESTF